MKTYTREEYLQAFRHDISSKEDCRNIPIEELVGRLRKAGSIWYRNSDLLLLEESIRRVNLLLANQKETTDG